MSYKALAISWKYKFMVALVYLGGISPLIYMIIHEIWRERNFQILYGANWVAEYEKYRGSLVHAHIKIAIAVTTIILLGFVVHWLYRKTTRIKRKRREHH